MFKVIQKLLFLTLICVPLLAHNDREDSLHSEQSGSTIAFNPEITFKIKEQSNWLGFVNAYTAIGRKRDDFFLSPGFGAKYLIPYDEHYFYVGLGVNPVGFGFYHNQPKYAFAPIFAPKLGIYVHIAKNFFINICGDLFVMPAYSNPVQFVPGIGVAFLFM